MKNIIIITVVIVLTTSCTYKLTRKSYITIEPWKEWEIELKLNEDSTFEITDRFGCTTFNYSGQWHYHENSDFNFLILNDTSKSEYIQSHNAYQVFNKSTKQLQLIEADKYFPVISTDTIWVLNNKRMIFRGLTFDKEKFLSSKDLSKKRVKQIENYYVSRFSKDFFIKAFGNGGGIEEAKKNIKECKIYPIPNLSIGKNQ